jgi:hypothetical protein
MKHIVIGALSFIMFVASGNHYKGTRTMSTLQELSPVKLAVIFATSDMATSGGPPGLVSIISTWPGGMADS